jgi:nucleotide-binding universal stress UspA family protein
MFVGARQIMSTVLDLDRPENSPPTNASKTSSEAVKASIEAAALRLQSESGEPLAAEMPTVLTNRPSTEDPTEAVLNELEKGYDMIFLGIRRALHEGDDPAPHLSLDRLLREFTGALAIVVAKGTQPPEALTASLNILIPTTGADYSRRAAEVAIAIAKACRGRVTTMHVSPPPQGTDLLRQPRRLATMRALVEDIQSLGEREGIAVSPMIKFSRTPAAAIMRQIKKGRHNLVVLGVKARLGEELFFGHGTEALLARTPCSLLLVNS